MWGRSDLQQVDENLSIPLCTWKAEEVRDSQLKSNRGSQDSKDTEQLQVVCQSKGEAADCG